MSIIWECAGGPGRPPQIIQVEPKESTILIEALDEYCKNHPRKKKAKKLLGEFEMWLVVT